MDGIMSETSIWEGTEVLARFHDGNSMYLYCTVSRADSNSIKAGMIKYPLKLYENAYVANKMSEEVYISDKVTLRFAIRLEGVIYYDIFLLMNENIKSKFKVSVEEYKSKCDYIRALNKQKGVIEYTMLNQKPIINVQEI